MIKCIAGRCGTLQRCITFHTLVRCIVFRCSGLTRRHCWSHRPTSFLPFFYSWGLKSKDKSRFHKYALKYWVMSLWFSGNVGGWCVGRHHELKDFQYGGSGLQTWRRVKLHSNPWLQRRGRFENWKKKKNKTNNSVYGARI